MTVVINTALLENHNVVDMKMHCFLSLHPHLDPPRYPPPPLPSLPPRARLRVCLVVGCVTIGLPYRPPLSMGLRCPTHAQHLLLASCTARLVTRGPSISMPVRSVLRTVPVFGRGGFVHATGRGLRRCSFFVCVLCVQYPGQCLVTSKPAESRCSALHEMTRRLCPCVSGSR